MAAAVTLATLTHSPVMAQDAAAAPQSAGIYSHPELQKFKDQGGEVEFLGHAYGLDGWLIAKEGIPPQTAYTTPEGGLVMGPLVNPEGFVETTNQLAAYKAKAEGRSQDSLPGADKSTAPTAERFYAEVEKAAWVSTGNADAPYIYLFMNVTCDHCQTYWKSLEKSVADGKLQVRLLPFGAREENRNTGAALLSVENPGQAWTQFIKGNKDSLSAANIKEGTLASIDANGALLSKWKVSETPFTIYRRLNDGQVTVVSGKPDNAMLIMADLLR